MGNEIGLEEFHQTFPAMKEYIPNLATLSELKAWCKKIAPHFRGKDYRSKNNDRIRIEMRRIVFESGNIKLDDDHMIDLIVDFLLLPYL